MNNSTKGDWQLVGVDTGGTFTDLILYRGQSLYVRKVLSTPRAPAEAIIKGLTALKVDLQSALDLMHGSTVATNAVLERKGARTAYITNRGFADVLTLGRQAREDLYDLTPTPKPPPVPHELCLETGGRITCGGEVLDTLSEQDLAVLKQQLRELAPEAIAINFLFSFIDETFEKAVADALRQEDYFISRSSAVLPEQREYERGIATWLNSYVGPVMTCYLKQLSLQLPSANIRVMQSHGRTIQACQAGNHSVNLLLSGPAAGVTAARQIAALSGHKKALSFDMGGTSTDVAMIDGDITLTNQGQIENYPVSVPMIDIHTVGAGGGSIVYIDEGGLLRVGPQSAAATPGPASYGLGGEQPTITDANLLLNRLPEALGNHLRLNRAAAIKAFTPLARQLAMEVDELASGAIDIVNEQMTRALYLMSAQKGYDPSDFLLVGFGAAGGLHICTLAENMQIRQAIVPAYAGVLSAIGMLTAEQGLQKTQTVCKPLTQNNLDSIKRAFQNLLKQARQEMAEQEIAITDTQLSADLRYQGQWYCLSCQWQSLETLIELFHQTHEKLHGYRLPLAIELVSVKIQVSASVPLPMEAVLKHPRRDSPPAATSTTSAMPIFWRPELGEQIVQGPAIIAETTATTYVKDNWRAQMDSFGNLHLKSA